jgi:hypothetical protein
VDAATVASPSMAKLAALNFVTLVEPKHHGSSEALIPWLLCGPGAAFQPCTNRRGARCGRSNTDEAAWRDTYGLRSATLRVELAAKGVRIDRSELSGQPTRREPT